MQAELEDSGSREHAVLTTDPRGLGVVNAELRFVQIRHGQLRLAAARELHWENTVNSSQIRSALTADKSSIKA